MHVDGQVSACDLLRYGLNAGTIHSMVDTLLISGETDCQCVLMQAIVTFNSSSEYCFSVIQVAIQHDMMKPKTRYLTAVTRGCG